MLAAANAASLVVGAETTDGVISVRAAENVMAETSIEPEGSVRPSATRIL